MSPEMYQPPKSAAKPAPQAEEPKAKKPRKRKTKETE